MRVRRQTGAAGVGHPGPEVDGVAGEARREGSQDAKQSPRVAGWVSRRC